MNDLVVLDDKYPIERSRLLDAFDLSTYTPDEILLLDVYLSKINPQDRSTKRVQFRKKEYELFLEKKRQQAKLFKDTAVGLFYKPFDPTYLPGDIGFNPKSIWKECSFEKSAETNEWVFTMECSDDALPFFFDTQKYGFIRYLVGYTKRFTKKYSFILYYFLKRRRQEELKYGNAIQPTVDELKRITGTSRTKTFKEFKYFKRDVLEIAVGEINSLSDISVTFESIKNGRGVEKIHFRVTEKVSPPSLEYGRPEPSEEMKELFAAEIEEMDAVVRKEEKQTGQAAENAPPRDETDVRLLKCIPEECHGKLPIIRNMLEEYAKTGNRIFLSRAELDETLCEILKHFNPIYEAAKGEGIITKSAGGWYITVLEKYIEKGQYHKLINEAESDGGFDMEKYQKMLDNQ